MTASSPEAVREYNRAYYIRNREKLKARVRDYAVANADKVLAYQRQYRIANAERRAEYKRTNKEAILAQGRAWYQANAARKRAYTREWSAQNLARRADTQRLRQARKRGAVGFATHEQVQARRDYYGGLCAYCGDVATSIDHVIPVARGGSNWPANLRPACGPCNTGKNDLPLAVFLERKFSND